MSRKRITHADSDDNAYPHDAGLLGLEHEIRATPTNQLADLATLLVELTSPLAKLAHHRFRLTLWELQRRVAATGRAA